MSRVLFRRLFSIIPTMIAASALMRRPALWQSSFVLRAATLSMLFWFIVVFGVFNNRQFIYFQF